MSLTRQDFCTSLFNMEDVKNVYNKTINSKLSTFKTGKCKTREMPK